MIPDVGSRWKFPGSGHVWEIQDPIDDCHGGPAHWYAHLVVRDPQAPRSDDRGVGFRSLVDLERLEKVGIRVDAK